MSIVFDRPHALIDKPMHYCPGCTHGIVHRLIAEVIDELGIEGKTVGVSPVGCTYNNYEYFNCDMVQAAHGRAPAVATGLRRSLPENVVFTYQGDGDLAAIGTAEIVHAATRGGRKPELHGYPVRVCELLSTLEGAAYIERVAVNNVKNIRKAKEAIKKAFEMQIEGKGFTLVEILSTCPTNWGMNPLKALKWLEEKMIPHYPLGVSKDVSAD